MTSAPEPGFRVLIVDDEAIARRRIARLVRAEEGTTVVAECASADEAVAAIREHRPDLVFLDVQMPGGDGFEVVARLAEDERPAIVFVTAHDSYAMRAFDVHATDYLLKPFEAARFRAAFARVRRQHEQAASADAGRRLRALLAQLASDERLALPASGEREPDERRRERFMIRNDGRVVLVRAADVDWIEAAGNYVRLHVGKATHTLRETMSAVDASLDPAQFARIHRATIVNLDRVREMQAWFGGDYVVILTDGTRLRLSRTYRDALAARMERR